MKVKLKYDYVAAGPIGHAQEVMKKIAKMYGFEIIDSEPQSLGDCWFFTVETKADHIGLLPCYLTMMETPDEEAPTPEENDVGFIYE